MLFDLYSTPEWRLRNRLDYFAFSLELFQRNYAELLEIIVGIEETANPVAFLAVGENWKRHELLKEVSFRFHNFLAAAKSLLDHARMNYQQHYQSAGTFPEYPREVKTRFEDDGLVRLVHGMREMAQHYRLPNIGWSANLNLEANSIRIEVTLRREDLLSYDGWKSAAKAYLAAETAQTLSVRAIAEEYQSKINAFYEWLFADLQRIHAAEFERLHVMQSEELQRNTAEIIRALEQDVSQIEQGIHQGHIRDVVCSLLTPVEHRRLHSLECEPLAWFEAALPTLVSRVPLPEQLVDRLKTIAARSDVTAG